MYDVKRVESDEECRQIRRDTMEYLGDRRMISLSDARYFCFLFRFRIAAKESAARRKSNVQWSQGK